MSQTDPPAGGAPDVVRIMREIRESIQRKRAQGIYTDEEVESLTALRLRAYGEEARIDGKLLDRRYGEAVIGGAELHARWLAQRLAERHEVEVLTTTAVDYLSWENKYEPGPTTVGGLAVRRFEVARRRTAEGFDELSSKVHF